MPAVYKRFKRLLNGIESSGGSTSVELLPSTVVTGKM